MIDLSPLIDVDILKNTSQMDNDFLLNLGGEDYA